MDCFDEGNIHGCWRLFGVGEVSGAQLAVKLRLEYPLYRWTVPAVHDDSKDERLWCSHARFGGACPNEGLERPGDVNGVFVDCGKSSLLLLRPTWVDKSSENFRQLLQRLPFPKKPCTR